jgi:hypothetical protein
MNKIPSVMSFGDFWLIARKDTKFIYTHNLYAMTSRLEDMPNVWEMMVNWKKMEMMGCRKNSLTNFFSRTLLLSTI